jgi:hypothetical protein
MKAWFTGCESCGRLTPRVSRLCLVCELEREAAMSVHPSTFARIRHVKRRTATRGRGAA